MWRSITWQDCEFEWRLELPPRQESIRRVPGQPAALIRIDHRIRVVSEELIEIVQIAEGLGSDVGGVQRSTFDLVLGRELELAIKAAAGVGERNEAKVRLRIEHEIASCIALLEACAHDKSGRQLPVQFNIPADATRIPQAARNGIDEILRTENRASRREHCDRAAGKNGNDATLSGTRS